MLKFLKPFLIFVVLYHLFVTIIGFGIFGGAYPQAPALGRDGIWVLFFIGITIANIKSIKAYLKTRKRPRMSFIAIIIFGTILSLTKGKGRYDIFVGIKYGLLYLFIFLSSTFIGYLWDKKEENKTKKTTSNIIKFQKFLKYILIFTIIGGFLRQGLKFIWPDLFLHIGYGPLNDFKFGVKPPIYYLTGYKGTARRQGIFSGPNNYGYFLIAFLPVIWYMCRQKITSIKNIWRTNKMVILQAIILLLWIVAITLTLSRTAFIGGILAIAAINIQRIKRYKKTASILGILALAGIVGLSALKGASTLGHIQAKFGSIKYVINQPSGYGLGTSGPAVHQNGTILPENYYLQLMLDIGTIGFLMWTVLIMQITKIAKKIQQTYREKNNEEKYTYILWKGLTIGRFCLLVMGIFLHVFEDSMVNYLFFISRGVLTGYLSTYIKKDLI